ncbi:MAG: hypothetical protein HUU20_24015 [Pirellulales bacterium]|nr:hypothetical protein [Pirellulales bacterium]
MKRMIRQAGIPGATCVCTAVIAGLVLGLTGCGGGEAVPETAPVRGVVTYKGNPVADAQVAFRPEKGNPATGRTDAEGKFVLTTFKAEDGAVPGTHSVTVQVMPEGALPGMETQSTGAASIPPKYADPAQTPLKIDVKGGEPNEVKLELAD